MRNSAEIQLIGYVYQDAKCPNERDYPNWVTFKMSVNKKYKDKNRESTLGRVHYKISYDKQTGMLSVIIVECQVELRGGSCIVGLFPICVRLPHLKGL
jgi:hypothetical protein